VVASTSPAAGATGVALGSTVMATFNEAVQSGTISFVLDDPNGNPVNAIVTYDSSTDTATLTPQAALAPSTTYTATVSGAQDLAGTAMTGPDSWSFTTGDSSPTLTALNFNAKVTSLPVVINSEMFFSATDSVHGSQLWESDGTAGGTTMLTDINASHGGLNPKTITAVGNTVYFSASDGADGIQLWSSNGTSTVMVTDANPGLGFFPQDLTNVSGTLYLVGYNASDGYQIYTSNGTAGGTVMVADINGTAGSNPTDLTVVGGTVYFNATESGYGSQLWESDGTSSGTVMVADIGGATSANPSNLTNVDGTLFFSAYTSAYGTQLWESDGTSSGTTMAVDVNGTAGANLTDFVVVGTTLYMQAPGASLWKVTT
jgi:ELWxxDGT repeat protein